MNLHLGSDRTGPPKSVQRKATMRLREERERLLADLPARQLSFTIV